MVADLRFVWDAANDRADRREHGVSFAEARSAFHDENAREFDDPDHSEDEERFILLGISPRSRVLVVCHGCRESESVVSIISARRAAGNEETAHWELCR